MIDALAIFNNHAVQHLQTAGRVDILCGAKLLVASDFL
jgi:hypothetical protein